MDTQNNQSFIKTPCATPKMNQPMESQNFHVPAQPLSKSCRLCQVSPHGLLHQRTCICHSGVCPLGGNVGSGRRQEKLSPGHLNQPIYILMTFMCMSFSFHLPLGNILLISKPLGHTSTRQTSACGCTQHSLRRTLSCSSTHDSSMSWLLFIGSISVNASNATRGKAATTKAGSTAAASS